MKNLELELRLSSKELLLFKRALRDAKSISFREHLMKTWGGWSYQVHLDRVDDVLVDFGYGENTLEGYCRRIAAVFHDIIEDCGWTYNNVKEFILYATKNKEAAYHIADICFAVTDEKGKNRKQRKPDKLYNEMMTHSDYVIIKLADRIVNVGRSGRMKSAYKQEYTDFKNKLFEVGMCDDLWDALDMLHK